MSLWIASSSVLTSEIKESIESASTPVPLFLPAFLIVLQMSPGRWSA